VIQDQTVELDRAAVPGMNAVCVATIDEDSGLR
jgi:hypothetical protein